MVTTRPQFDISCTDITPSTTVKTGNGLQVDIKTVTQNIPFKLALEKSIFLDTCNNIHSVDIIFADFLRCISMEFKILQIHVPAKQFHIIVK